MKISNIRLTARSGLEMYLPDSSIIKNVYNVQIKDLKVPNEVATRNFLALCKSDSVKIPRIFHIFVKKDIIGDKKTYKLCRKAYYRAKSALHKEERRLVLGKRKNLGNIDY